MISVTELSKNYASVWKKTFPFISKLVRKCNLQKESFEEHLVSDIAPSRRALVNEIAFRLFEKAIDLNLKNVEDIESQVLEEVSEKTRKYIAGLEKTQSLEVATKHEIAECFKIAKRTKQYFNDYDNTSKLVVSPFFSGCGIVSSCYGDVLSNDTLYEIKAGDRDFRVSDLKQLLVYSTLNFANHEENIKFIALVNPRLGIFVKLSIKESVELASGKSAADAFNELINFFDNPDDFR